ncbi:Small subunit (SSU) processome component [Coemansia biformis]|uniref:Small subunit (SSU) processome component n=1 Tax=Coemansia biformis TaxID=1286918 RepID=A0A9W7Y7Q6_9FUNG|nr:Small subunit (SSU) processome component [Coemansia biformis]
MVKRTVHRKKSHGLQTTKKVSKTSTVQEDTDRWTCAFDGASSDGSLALVRSGINGHKLRIIDVHTGVQRSEFSSGNGGKIKCIAWGHQPKTSASSQVLVALGMQDGKVLLYSPARNAIVRTLEGAHENVEVTSVTFVGAEVFSLDSTGILIQWDIASGSLIKQLKTGLNDARALLVSSDAQRAVVASHRIELWDLSKQSKVQSWPGHTSAIHSLLWAADETALVSAAQSDRHVHVWDATAHNASQPLAVLNADSEVVHVDVSLGGSVLSVGDDGVLCAWHQAAQTSGNTSSRRRNDIGYSADGVVRIATSGGLPLPVLLARFSRVATSEGSVMLVRGSSVKPLFETLELADQDGQFAKEIVLTREAQDNMLIPAAKAKTDAEKQLSAQLHSYSEQGASVTNPVSEGVRKAQRAADDALPDQPSLADRIRQLSVGTDAHAPSDALAAGLKLGSGTLVRVLVQSLHTSDHEMLDTVLGNSSRTNVVRDTVLALPAAYVLAFLQQLFVRFQSTPARAAQLLPWIRNTLALHSAYLTSIPSLVPQLAGFYQGIEARLETHQKLLRLSGRLELANTQIRARAHHMKEQQQQQLDAQKQTAMKPLNVYHESEDDDESAVGSTEPPTPVWQAEESTDDEDVGGSEDGQDDQWSDDNDDDDEDASEDDDASDASDKMDVSANSDDDDDDNADSDDEDEL